MEIEYLLPIGVLQIRQPRVLAYLRIIIKYLYLPPSAETSRLNNPQVLSPIHIALYKSLRVLGHDILDKLISIDPIRILPVMFSLKRFVFAEMLRHLNVDLLKPLLPLDEFDVRLRVVTS
jgi:hypothetical protein